MRTRRLWPQRERSNIPSMDTLRTSLIYVLAMTMSLSSWANAASPCDADRHADVAEITSIAHVHPGSSEGVDHRGHQASDQPANDAQDNSADSMDCVCCDDCVAVCALTGVNPVTSASAFVVALFDAGAGPIPLDVEFRRGPPPQSLFRPPITQA